MISISAIVNNPLGKTFKNLFSTSVRLWSFKYVEVQSYIDTYTLFEFGFKWDRKCDHAGLHITVCIFTVSASVNIYDSRHWDYEKDTWQNPSWTITLEEDPETGDVIMPIPPEALKMQGWKEGDTLEWTDNKNGTWSLTKV